MSIHNIAYNNYTHEKALLELSGHLTNSLDDDDIETVCQRLHLDSTTERQANIDLIINELEDAMLDMVLSVLAHVEETYVWELDPKPIRKAKGLFSKSKG